MPTEENYTHSPTYVNPQTRAQLREQLLKLRFRLMQPLAPADYWRLHDEAEELSVMLAGPTHPIDPRCEAAPPPVYATREAAFRLLHEMTRFTKGSL